MTNSYSFHLKLDHRLYWLIAVAASVWMCSALIRNVWTEWDEKLVTMSFSEKVMPVSSIPFPAITICPEIKTFKHKFDVSATLDSLSNLSRVQRTRLNALAHVCTRLPNLVEYTDNYTDTSVYNSIQNVALTLEKSMGTCKWQNEPYTFCSKYFVPIFTDDGVCFAFNALNSNETYTRVMASGTEILRYNSHWSLDSGYKSKSDVNDYPIRMHNAGPSAAFSILLSTFTENLEYRCRGFDQGFKVVLSVPGEALKLSRNFLRVPTSADTFIKITPKLTTFSEGILKYTPAQRQCFHSDERRLRFYKIYTKSSCEVECLANFTNIECGCVKFSMPRDKHTKMCGGASVKCYWIAEKRLATTAQSFRDQCNCLPTCTSIEYKAEVDRINYDAKDAVESMAGDGRVPYNLILTRLAFFYKSNQMETIKRIEMYTFFDFLAICGGLLGLGLGVSLLSIIELAYFSTLRWFWTIRRSRSDDSVTALPADSSADNGIAARILCTLRAFFVEFGDNSNWKRITRFVCPVGRFFKEYCDNSNIHGLRYFTERILHWSERLWWFTFVGVSFCLCSSMIRNVWVQWQENPVKMSFSESENVSAIPFPTVTICPETKFLKSKGKFDISSAFSRFTKLSDVEFAEMMMAMHICSYAAIVFKEINYTEANKYINDSIYDFIEDAAPRLDDVMYKCWWQNKICDCSKYVAPIFTESGICFAFNALNSHDIYTDEMAPGMMITKNMPNVSHWSLESGYANEMSDGEYPIRAVDSGKNAAFDVVLTLLKRNFDFHCKGFDQGFRVILSMPGEELKATLNSLRVPISENSLITIKPKWITTSDGLRSYRPNQRQCFYQNERRLRFFKMYTQTNCEEECLSNFTKLECGCVKFSMPRDVYTTICGTANINCYETAMRKLSTDDSPESFSATCNCIPACTSIEYSTSIDHIKFDAAAINKIPGYKSNDSDIQQTRLAILIQGEQVETAKRMEVYTFSDFLAICGGLLGLFMGISALSIIELLYYATLRVYWTIRYSRLESNALLVE